MDAEREETRAHRCNVRVADQGVAMPDIETLFNLGEAVLWLPFAAVLLIKGVPASVSVHAYLPFGAQRGGMCGEREFSSPVSVARQRARAAAAQGVATSGSSSLASV